MAQAGKPKQKRFSKTTKKIVVKLQCRQCGYVIMKPLGRLKKVELAETR